MDLFKAEQDKKLREIFSRLTNGITFRTRPAVFMIPLDSLSTGQMALTAKLVGEDEVAEKELWNYINSLSENHCEKVSHYFGWIKDIYNPDLGNGSPTPIDLTSQAPNWEILRTLKTNTPQG
jgi:hypothetical protein